MADREEFLALARKRFDTAQEEEKDLRDAFISDLKFASPDGADQWDPQIKIQRDQAGRPAMSFPRCHTFVQQVANEARQNKPQIKFAPRLDADKDTADVYEGLARFIQYESQAQVAYETAIEYSAGGSFGYYRFLTEYCDDDSDDLDLKVVPVLDPLTIYGILVPSCFGQKPTFAFVVRDISKEEYKAKWPNTELASLPWAEAERRYSGWVASEKVRIAEYWWVEEEKIEGKRRPKRNVKTCTINGFEVLPDTETDWAGSSIPIVPVLGKQMIMEGKPKLFSVVRPQKAAQQLINYSKSRIAETLSTSPISPFMVAEGQIAGYEKEWATLNTQNRPFLTYKMVDIAGRPLQPPQRQTFEPPIQALSAFVMQEVDDMKATTGIFDASLGNSANEVTGKAIMARQQQSNLSIMHFMDNLERSFKQGGEIIAELIPKIYDTERQIQIMGEDEAQKVIKINAPHTDENGKQRHYDMTKGKYTVVVTMGRAFSTKRMETFDTMQQLVQSAPNLLPIFGDVMFRNSDVAGGEIVAERFHKMLPPQLQNDEDNPLPPQAQAAIAQAQQQAQAMQAEIAKLTMERDAKVLDHQGKMQQIQLQHQADMELEDKKLAVEVAKAEITTKAQNEEERQLFVQDIVKELLKHQNTMRSQHEAQAHEAGMEALKHHHSKDAASQQAEISAAQAEQQSAAENEK
jgi:hypothetical protein